MTIDSVLSWLAEASVVLSIVALLLFAVRAAAWRRLAADWIYALWLAVPVALIASFAPAGLVELPIDGAARWLLVPWLLGVAGLFAADVRSHLLFDRRIVRVARTPGAGELTEIERAAAGTTLVSARDFLFSDRVDGPVAFGFRRPTVLLPEDFLARYGAAERRGMTLHEAEHLRAGHIVHRLAARILRNVFWFHPLVWVAERAFIADQELACDSAALQLDHSIRPRSYATALLKAAELVAGRAPAAPAGSAPLIAMRGLRRRTLMLDRHLALGATRRPGALLLGGVAVAALLAGLSTAPRIEPASPIVGATDVPEPRPAPPIIERAPTAPPILPAQSEGAQADDPPPSATYVAPMGGAITSAATAQALNRAIERLGAEDYAGAQAAMDALELDGLSPYERARAEQLLFQIDYAQERYDEARAHLEAALASGGLDAQESQNLRFQIAQTYVVEERWAEAAQALEGWFSLSFEPSAAAYYLLAVASYQLGDFAQALPHAEQAVELGNPPQQAWYQLLAALYHQLGMTAELEALEAEAPMEFLPLAPDPK